MADAAAKVLPTSFHCVSAVPGFIMSTAFPCDLDMYGIASIPFGASILALITVIALRMKMMGADTGKAFDQGNKEEVAMCNTMNELSAEIKQGAKNFLITEYTYLLYFVVLFAILLFILFGFGIDGNEAVDGINIAICFITGAGLSAGAGWLGMMVATDANVRTTQAARQLPEEKGGPRGPALSRALNVAFTGGSVMGFTVVGLGLFGVSVLFVIMQASCSDAMTRHRCMKSSMSPLAGFGFGASAIALFARVAGGIFTKAADVGADLVGKVEAGIPEDDPRNPAVIADNVGDNVGDVAGMGADLFESFVGSLIAAMTLATGAAAGELDLAKVALPFWISGGGIIASLIGYFCVRIDPNDKNIDQHKLLSTLHRGTYVSSLLIIIWAAVLVPILFSERSDDGWKYFGCIIIGLVTGILIGEATEYFTSYAYTPTFSITKAGKTGPATVIIQGLGIGMLSCVPPVILLVVAVLACTSLAGEYGVAIAAVGMLSTLGITLATDAYGPVADNAGGVAEMADCPPEVRETTDELDALGNTTAATGKGFAIGSAVLTALSLLAAFKEAAFTKVNPAITLEVTDSVVLSGVLFGAMLPYLFAALTMLSVRKAAGSIIAEVRKQFRAPGIKESFLEGATPESKVQAIAAIQASGGSKKCVEIATQSSVKEMILPGIYAVLSPAVVGMLVGPTCLAGMLAGSIASGCMLGIMMSNAGGAWDNSKKYIEIEGQPEVGEFWPEDKFVDGIRVIKKGDKIKGHVQGPGLCYRSQDEVDMEIKAKPSYDKKKGDFVVIPKHTEHHDGCVVGDTVGDPFKDTSGPALNILIKLMSMISLTIAPIIKDHESYFEWYWGLIPVGLCIILSFLGENPMSDPDVGEEIVSEGKDSSGYDLAAPKGGAPMDHVDAIAELHASDGTDTEYIEEQKAMLAADTE